MNSQAKLIDINDWEEFGGGFTATSYYHKTDDSLMMKLYAPFMPAQEGFNELRCAEEVLNMGIPTAKSIEYVTDGQRFGAVFERIKNKKSIARLLADDPNHLEDYAKIFAEEVKKLHSKKCTSSFFASASEKMISDISNADVLSDIDKKQAIKIVENTPEGDTCLHGDLHVGNMIIANGKAMFIDLGDFAKGNPLFDLGLLYFSSHSVDKEITMRLYHIDTSIYLKFWDSFVKYYFDSTDGIDELLAPYRYLTAIRYSAKINHIQPEFAIIIDEYNKNR